MIEIIAYREMERGRDGEREREREQTCFTKALHAHYSAAEIDK
jgi:hypothetical protein